jgi:FAD/FMN-containing dehydrogenase
VSEVRTGELEQRLRGEIVKPGDPTYDEIRKIYNGMHDPRPALIVLAAGVADVIAAVRFARENDLMLAVRGGGHSAPGFGTCEGGLVLDLRRMKGIRVDPERRTVRAEGGCTLGDVDHATYAFGLATPFGIASTTGIAGLTLGGGIGYLTRRCGLSCDNLLSADVVTADGAYNTCSGEREEDLFWAIRGGGGNFGVVTSFEFRLHPVADILGGPIFFPLDGDVVRSYRDFILDAPEELGALFAFTMAAPLPFLPEKWHGKPVSAVIACWSGAVEDGEKVLAAVKTWGEVIGAYLDRMPNPVLNSMFDALLPPGLQHYWKGNFARDLPDDAIEAHLEHAPTVPCIETGTFLYPMNGACQRVPSDETAFAYRDALFATVIGGAWQNPADNEQNMRWVREYDEALRPYSEASGYVNFMASEDQGRVRINYRQNYERLVEIKSRYDPTNLFRLNHNIEPAP